MGVTGVQTCALPISHAAPSSSTRRPRARLADRSQNWRAFGRRPVTANRVPTGSPASAAGAAAVEVTTTGTPAPDAIRAASTLVAIPPVPTPLRLAAPSDTEARSAAGRTVLIRDAGTAGGPPT